MYHAPVINLPLFSVSILKKIPGHKQPRYHKALPHKHAPSPVFTSACPYLISAPSTSEFSLQTHPVSDTGQCLRPLPRTEQGYGHIQPTDSLHGYSQRTHHTDTTSGPHMAKAGAVSFAVPFAEPLAEGSARAIARVLCMAGGMCMAESQGHFIARQQPLESALMKGFASPCALSL